MLCVKRSTQPNWNSTIQAPGNEDVSGSTSESILNYQLSILNS